MLKNYFKIAFRTLWKNKAYAVINIIGLAIGISGATLFLTFVKDELSFDQQHSKFERIVRPITIQQNLEEPNYPSMIEMVKQGKDVIVSKTFSKVFGLAGLRIGYLVAKPSTARRLRQNMVANTNMMAITGANAAMEDKEFYDFSIAKNKEAKSMMRMTMDDLGLKYADSHTNFLFFETGMDIERFNRMMLDEGVQVGRPFPPYRNGCRVSTGLIEEVEMFNAALRKIVG